MWYDHVVRRGRVLSFLAASLSLAILAGCTDSVTSAREPAELLTAAADPFQLPEVTGTACRWGGEYPNCNSSPGSTEPTPGGQPVGGPPMEPGTGGGSGTPPPQDSTSMCDPRTDPNCEKPLTHADSATILKALTDHVRRASSIADTANRRKCTDMLNQFMQSFNTSTVFRGGSNTRHFGATNNDRIHFDPWLLDGAIGGNADDQRELANTALHEAAHVMGFDHLNGEVNGVYSDSPFNLLPPGTGPCIK